MSRHATLLYIMYARVKRPNDEVSSDVLIRTQCIPVGKITPAMPGDSNIFSLFQEIMERFCLKIVSAHIFVVKVNGVHSYIA